MVEHIESLSQTQTDEANAHFWDEMCGTVLADQLGVYDDSPVSLRKFDDWYMNHYDYLYKFIPFQDLEGKDVLEVGLGYGTVSELLAKTKARYTGLDIAKGPVDFINHRLSQNNLEGKAVQGSILEPPFDTERFDYIVAIGCLHHTGSLKNALESVCRLLKKGGGATIMVYSATSYKHWANWPARTLKRIFSDPTKYHSTNEIDDEMRKMYDTAKDGDWAPYTEFVTKRELQFLARDFSRCQITDTNVDVGPLKPILSRKQACKWFGPLLGRDHYCRLVK
ncbi:class I SAM-dependent methyltransferase [Terasakiella pusilla]|uniref:class I SAM-dependent methyltransferase n=1 Tax=Terasakiella pusilla TaxID=64973 RepID=UPI003AA82539